MYIYTSICFQVEEADGSASMSALAILTCRQNSHPFQERHIALLEPVKIGRSVARARPHPSNGIFDCKVLSRNHAMLWYENGIVSTLFEYVLLVFISIYFEYFVLCLEYKQSRSAFICEKLAFDRMFIVYHMKGFVFMNQIQIMAHNNPKTKDSLLIRILFCKVGKILP